MPITAQERLDLITLINGVFDAAPTVRVLSNLTNLVEAGNSVDQIATMLTNNTNFEGMYPSALLSTEFASQFVARLLGSEATESTTARAEALVLSFLNNGDSRTEAIWKVTKLLRDTTDAEFAAASAQLNNQADVSLAFALDTQYVELLTLEQLQSVIANVTSDVATATAAKEAIAAGEGVSGSSTGEVFTLTVGVDNGAGFTGSSRNDTFNANHDITNDVATLGALDTLDGGAGNDTLAITSDDNAAYTMAQATISNIENITIAGSLGVTADVSGSNISGLEKLSVTKATAATLTADSETAIEVSGVTGLTSTTGGSAVVVSQDTSAQVSGTADANVDTVNSITVANAKDVTITATNSEANVVAATGANKQDVDGGISVTNATGAVSISATGAKADGDDATLDAITVTGGTTVNVTQVATSDNTKALTDTNGATHTFGAVTITAGDNTTDVTVAQGDQVSEVNYSKAVTGVVEQQSVKFVALTKGQAVTIDGLTFTASQDLTAAQVASAFAGLTKGGDLQDNGGVTSNGVYTGSLDTAWVSGEASGDTVVFSQAVAGTGTFDSHALNGATVTQTQTSTTAVTGAAGVLGVANGAVVVDDNATASVKTLTVDGYGAGATLGAKGSLNALETLTLSNSGAGTAAVTTNVKSLTLNVNDVDEAVTVSNTVENLVLNADTTASNFALNTTGVKSATINANANLTLGGTALAGSTSAQSVTVTGTGTVALGDISTNVGLNTFNASGNTGGVSAQIATKDATVTGAISEYVFSAGNDTITLDETAIDVAVSAGAGDDRVILANGTTSAAKAVTGGAGTDTLEMLTANAVTASQNATFAGQVTGFEVLSLRGATGAQEVEADVLGNYNTVEIKGAVAGSATTVDGVTSGATLILGDNTNVQTILDITDAKTNTADVVNVTINATGEDSKADSNGIVRADNVETINISVNDTSTVQTPTDTKADAQSLDLVATSATTINVTGDTSLTLDTDQNQKVSAINAADFTGNLTVTAAGGVATTITAGSGNDVLTASKIAATAQVSTITITDGTSNTGLGNGDTMSVVVGGTTFTYTSSGVETLATAGTGLAALINANAAYTAAYNAGVITVTAAVAGTPFTVSGYSVTDAVVTNATGTALTYTEGATNATAQIDKLTVTADGADEGNETVTVTFDTDGSAGASTADVVVDLSAVDVTSKAAITNAVVAVLNDNVGFSTVATASNVGDDVVITYKNTQAQTQASAAVGGTATTLAFAGSKTAAVQDIDTVVVTSAFTSGKALDKGDVISIDVDTDGAGAGAATTVSYTVATDGMSYDDAMTALAAAVSGTTSAAASATYTAGTDTLTVTDAASTDTNGLTLSNFKVTDVSSDQVVNTTGTSAAFATTTDNSVAGKGDTIFGGAGNDTITTGDLTQVTGGAGNDTFIIGTPTNVNSYATILDFSTGDVIDLDSGNAGTVQFQASAVVLASTAVFQDYANAAVNALGADTNDAAWFQYSGNTYIVQSGTNHNTTADFQNGTDKIIQLTGLVDLSADASYNQSQGTLELA